MPRWYLRLRAWGALHPWRFAAVFTLHVLAVALFVPVWEAVYFGAWEISGEPATFRGTLASLSIAVAKEPPLTVFRFFGWTAALLAGLLAASLAVGRWLGRRAGRAS